MRTFVLLTLLVAGCSSSPTVPCTTQSCPGCCDPNGVCQPGYMVDACGSGGFACSVCSGTDSCSAGACVPQSSGGGSGGSGGGGGSGGAGGSGGSGGGSALGTRAFIRPASAGGISIGTGTFQQELQTAGATGVDVSSTEPASFDAYRFVAILPTGMLAPSLISKLTTFHQAGGRILVVAERSGIGGVTAANELLAALGVAVRVAPDNYGQGCNSGMPVGTHPLTTGVTQLPYSWGSRVTGGTTLFERASQAIVAEEQNVIVAGDTGFIDGNGCGITSGLPFMQNLWSR